MSEVGAGEQEEAVAGDHPPTFLPEREVSWKTGQDIVGVGLGKDNDVMKEGKEALS